jgi:transcription initiation factor TFIID subunit 7
MDQGYDDLSTTFGDEFDMDELESNLAAEIEEALDEEEEEEPEDEDEGTEDEDEEEVDEGSGESEGEGGNESFIIHK